MASALIGYTGFVGNNLLNQQSFDNCYNSKNIQQIDGKNYDLLVCAGTPAAKWIANRAPLEDQENIEHLMKHLGASKIKKLILISTIDVYPSPVEVDELDSIDIEDCQPYGKHRLLLERFVSHRFDTLIVRLPALFGQGLKKNIIYDFLHDNEVNKINSEGIFQFYCLDHLRQDIETALSNNLQVLNITSQPINVGDVARICLGREFINTFEAPAARYDYRSRYADIFGGTNGYLYDRHQVLSDLEKFVALEKKQMS